jgi:hypothetical protein
VPRVCKRTASFTADERFGFVSQVRRASFSITAHVAEGRRRANASDFARHLDLAQGRAGKVEQEGRGRPPSVPGCRRPADDRAAQHHSRSLGCRPSACVRRYLAQFSASW